MIIVVTGSKGVGKSSSLAETAKIIKKYNKSVGGIISPSIWENGERCGYDLINLADGSKRLLATKAENVLKDAFRYGAFYFSCNAIIAGNMAILDGLCTDVLIVDEIGNMEIAGQGWAESIPLVRERKLPLVLSVREDVVDKLYREFGINIDKVIRVLSGEDTSAAIIGELSL